MKILITGAAQRVGYHITQFLASQGHKIIIHYNSSKNQAEELLQKIGGKSKGHNLIQADFSKQEQVENLLSKIPKIDVLINNASTFNCLPFAELSSQHILDDYQVNFLAPLSLMRQFKNLYRSGHIINFLDQRVAKVDYKAGTYGLAKKSLRDATEATAVEWAPEIQVNALAFGRILKPVGVSEEKWKKDYLEAPQKRTVSLDDICNACELLINSQLTGQVWYIDSGLHLV